MDQTSRRGGVRVDKRIDIHVGVYVDVFVDVCVIARDDTHV